MAEIPTVNFEPFMQDRGATRGEAPTVEQRKCAHEINNAFRVHGFLFLEDLGVTMQDLRTYFDMARALFALPDEYKSSKLVQLTPETNIGFIGSGFETLNTKRPSDLKEAYNVRNTRCFEHNFSACPPKFEHGFRSLWAKLEKAAQNFSIACAVALDLPHDFFLKAFHACNNSVARLNYFPPCHYEPGKSTGEDLSAPLRVGEHTDFGLFTILFNNEPGLQVKAVEGGEIGGSVHNEAGGWVDVPVPTGTTAIINTGALLARWTNDVWRATAHRVVVASVESASSDRYSIACFIDPDKEFIVEVHPSFVNPGEKPKYDPINAKDYILGKLRQAQPESTTIA